MALINAMNLTHAHGPKRVLDRVNLALSAGERVGLVGRNGCGKTTLMRLINDEYEPDDGAIQRARGVRVGYLPQDPKLDGSRTLRREAEQAFAKLADLHDQRDALSHDMADADGDELDKLMKRYEQLEHAIEAAGGYAIDHRIDATLHGLGLGDETFDVPVAGLSGGQKARLALAKLLLEEPDVLLLDEPTNHLDIAGRVWLERFLKEFGGAVMVVSHDRWLLDEVADRIVEVDRGRLFEYPGNYGAYREQRELRRLEQQRVFDKQQTYIRHQKQYIQRYKTGQRAKEARGRQKKLDRFIRDEVVAQVSHDGNIGLDLPAAPRSGDNVVVTNNNGIAVRYGDKTLFEKFAVKVQRGQRIGVIGPNGCGKSTLVSCLIGLRDPDEGSTRLGTNVSIGYYRQTHEHLDDDDTPISYLQRRVPDNAYQSARDLAGAFLFTGDEQEKTFGTLSGGERTRAVLAGLCIGGHNLLVLDEPSNHLDIPSAERLEEALRQFDGTLLLITHDRMLLQDTVDELLVFEPGQPVKHFYGTYRDWLSEKNKAEEAAKRPAPPEPKKKTGAKPQAAADKPRNPLVKMKDKELEKRIIAAETKLAELDQRLADPQLYKDTGAFRAVHDERKQLAGELEPLEAEWLRRAERG